MTGSRRILTVFGTRPEAIKLFPVLHALAADPRFASRVCVTGQHREMLAPVLSLAGIVPDTDFAVMAHGQSLDALTAKLLTGIGAVLDREQPDIVLVQGDTTSALAAALAAHYRRLPVAHVEAGLRSGELLHPWPEEANRKIIAALAAKHFAPTEGAAAALVRENVAPDTVHVTGNTVVDALRWIEARLLEQPELAAVMSSLEARFAGKRIIGVTAHRRESLGEGMRNIASALGRLAARPDVGIVFPVHRNPAVRKAMDQALGPLENVALIEPLDYSDFVRLLSIADLMLTDSGGVQEEAPSFGTPVLVMRETTERPEGVAAGTSRLVGTDPARIVAEADRLLDDPRAHTAMARAHNPYGDGHAAARIAELLAQWS